VTFDLQTIAIFFVGTLIYSALLPKNWRGWALMIGSVIAVYWLQSPIFVGKLDFILPTMTIIITVSLWWFTRIPAERPKTDENVWGDAVQRADTSIRPYRRWFNEDIIAFIIITTLVIGMSMMRYIEKAYRITPSKPPESFTVIQMLLVVGVVIYAIWWILQRFERNRTLSGLMLLVVVIFAVMKTEMLAIELSRLFRSFTAYDTDLANSSDLNWLGFSYVSFRLIHVLRDSQTGKLPALTLHEFMTYVIFFPSFVSGPIDRAERFVKDFRALPEKTGLDAPRYTEGTTRIMIGIFKKFVIADSLSMGMALNATNADQATSTVGLWLLLYGYALRLFFDFSGYSDIAIGIGILLGIKLPENFDRPYTKNNITVFWQSWHMTLSNWAKFYVFMPLTRFLLTRKRKPSQTVIVLSTQMVTMIVIGLWHGVTVNFVLWGVWHGVGLFAHKKWTDRTRKWYRELTPGRKRAWTVFGWFITLQFVVIGWVWFALPGIEQSLSVFGRLFGVGW
jgi:alginate O-acetyltransferase complex protein AlgI